VSTLVGHEWALSLLLNGLTSGRVSHATLIVGPPNIGKTTLARTFAQALNCTDTTARPCGVCISCRKVVSGNHPDVRILDAPGQPLKIDQVRELQHDLSLSPYEGAWSVAILCEFERATPEAANALLKTLEEPPSYVVLLLTATEADLLLPTIVSRCQLLALRTLPVSRVKEALMARWGVDEPLAELLAHLSGGRLGWAVSTLQDKAALVRRDEDLDHLLALAGQSRVERLAYAATLSRSPKQAEETLALWMSWWHDVLLVAAGAGVPLRNLDRTDSLREQARQLTLEQARRMVEQIGFIRRSLDQNVNLRLALEVLLLSWPSKN
jgi:DNA polymerase-3 subunit delta'